MSEQDTSTTEWVAQMERAMRPSNTAPEPTTPLEAVITAAAGGDPSAPVNVMVHRHGEGYYAIAEGHTGHLGRGGTADEALDDLRASLERAS